MPKYEAEGAYTKALVQVLRQQKKNPNRDPAILDIAATMKDPDLAAYLEAAAEHQSFRVNVTYHFEVEIEEWDDGTIIIAKTAGGDVYTTDGKLVTFVSHEVPSERGEGSSLEDLLIELVWNARDNGDRTMICDLVGDDPPY